MFTTEASIRAARMVMVIGEYEVRRDLVPTSSSLPKPVKPEVQRQILAEVAERLKPLQGELLAGADASAPALNQSGVVTKTTEIVVQHAVDIPRIGVVAKAASPSWRSGRPRAGGCARSTARDRGRIEEADKLRHAQFERARYEAELARRRQWRVQPPAAAAARASASVLE